MKKLSVKLTSHLPKIMQPRPFDPNLKHYPGEMLQSILDNNYPNYNIDVKGFRHPETCPWHPDMSEEIGSSSAPTSSGVSANDLGMRVMVPGPKNGKSVAKSRPLLQALGKRLLKARRSLPLRRSKGVRNLTRVLAPVSASYQRSNNGAKFNGRSTASIDVRHSELVDSVNNFTAFTLDIAAYIQPGTGVATPFTWLPGIASLYESYRVNRITFRYVPSCSTATDGAVLMGIDYDAADPNPVALTQLSSYQGSVRGSAWTALSLSYNLASSRVHGVNFYTRDADVPDTDIKTYDCGAFYLATYGASVNNAVIGELWVDYDITFITPHVPSDTVIPGGFPGGSAKLSSIPSIDTSSPFSKYGSLTVLGTPGFSFPVDPVTGKYDRIEFTKAGDYVGNFYFQATSGSFGFTGPTMTTAVGSGTYTVITQQRVSTSLTSAVSVVGFHVLADGTTFKWTNCGTILPNDTITITLCAAAVGSVTYWQ